MSEDRFCYTTDPEIGVPGYYKHREDGTIDNTVRYKWVDDLPDDPSSTSGHFEPHEHQYVRVGANGQAEQPAQEAKKPKPEPKGKPNIVSMQAEAGYSAHVEVLEAPAPPAKHWWQR